MNSISPQAWLDNYGDYLFNFAILRVKNAELAEDLVQDTLVSAWRAKDTFAGRSTEKTWLTSILRNKIIDHFRKQSREPEIAFTQHLEPDASEKESFSSLGIWKTYIPNWLHHPDMVIENEQFMQTMRGCVDKLPSSMAPVFVLKYIEDKEAEEVCEILGISPSNYWTILYRIRSRLRSCLQKNWYQLYEKGSERVLNAKGK